MQNKFNCDDCGAFGYITLLGDEDHEVIACPACGSDISETTSMLDADE